MAPTLYHYLGNADPHDGTETITGVGSGGQDQLEMNGEPKELTEEQVAMLSSRYQIVSQEAKRELDRATDKGSADTEQQFGAPTSTIEPVTGEGKTEESGEGSSEKATASGRRGGRAT